MYTVVAKILSNSDEKVRYSVENVDLLQSGMESVEQLLAAGLGDEQPPDVRLAIAICLFSTHNTAAFKTIFDDIALTFTDDDLVQREFDIVRAFRDAGEAAVQPLISALSSSSIVVRYIALAALSEIGDESIIDKLLPLQHDPIEVVRDRCIETIETLKEIPPSP